MPVDTPDRRSPRWPRTGERTDHAFGLPEGEHVDFDLVTDEPWAGFNYYLGDLRSQCDQHRLHRAHLAQASSPGGLSRAPHRAQPQGGRARAPRRRLEETIFLVGAPQCLLAEGLADLGLEVICGARPEPTVADHLRPLGIPYDAEVAARVSQATEALDGVRGNVASCCTTAASIPTMPSPTRSGGRCCRRLERRRSCSSRRTRRGGPTSSATSTGSGSAARSPPATRRLRATDHRAAPPERPRTRRLTLEPEPAPASRRRICAIVRQRTEAGMATLGRTVGAIAAMAAGSSRSGGRERETAAAPPTIRSRRRWGTADPERTTPLIRLRRRDDVLPQTRSDASGAEPEHSGCPAVGRRGRDLRRIAGGRLRLRHVGDLGRLRSREDSPHTTVTAGPGGSTIDHLELPNPTPLAPEPPQNVSPASTLDLVDTLRGPWTCGRARPSTPTARSRRRCSCPRSPGPHPVIVVAHGLGSSRTSMQETAYSWRPRATSHSFRASQPAVVTGHRTTS